MCKDVRNETTASMVATLTDLFNVYGYPTVLRSDGAPCFRQEFTKWCTQNDIYHETSSPGNSRSNGLAESAVKKAKKIVRRTGARGVELQALMQAANLAVTKDKNCPAEHFWQRQVRLPGHPSIKKDIEVGEQIKIRKERQSKLLGKKFSNRALTNQQKVRIQDPKTKLWNTKGVVVGSRVGDDGAPTSYFIETEEEGTLWRAAPFVRVRKSYLCNRVTKRVGFLLTECREERT
jgi:hypothetical protein